MVLQDSGAGSSTLEAEARAEFDRYADMRGLEKALHEARVAEDRAWWAMNMAANWGTAVSEISQTVAESGLAGQEMVRVHIAESRRLASARKVISAFKGTGFEAYARTVHGASAGRVTGVLLSWGRIPLWEVDGPDMDRDQASALLELLAAAGHVPEEADDVAGAVNALAGGTHLTLVSAHLRLPAGHWTRHVR